MAAIVDTLAFRADFSRVASFLGAVHEACVIDALGFEACLAVIACHRFTGVNIDTFAAFVAVASRLVGACLVGAWVFRLAFLIDAFFCFGAFRAGIVIDWFVDACLGVFVADFVVCAHVAAAKVFAYAVNAFLVVVAYIASAEVFADLVDAFLAIRACVARVGFFVFACAVFTDLVCAAFVARIFGRALILAFTVHALLIVCAHGIAAFRFALLADRITVVTAGCKCECHRGTAGKRKLSF